MTKEKQATLTRPDKQNGYKRESAVLAPEALQALSGGPAAQAGGLGLAAGQGDASAQAARLADARLRAAQRQALARQIGRQQGNRHLQRLLVSLKPDSDARADEEQPEAAPGWNGAQFAGGAPDGAPNNGANGKNGGRRAAGWVQRAEAEGEEGPTEAEKAAALAAAQRAEAQAGQSAGQAKAETSKWRAEQAKEAQAGQAAKQKAEQAKGGANAAGPVKPPAPNGKAAADGALGKKAAALAGKAADAAAGGAAPAAEAPTVDTAGMEKAPAKPEDDPGFQAVKAKVKGAAAAEKQHAAGAAKAGQAQAAAEMPAAEVEARAEAGQVGKMESAPAPGFNAAAFKARLMERIQELAPKNADQADKFKESNKLGGLKSEMQNQAAAERDAAKGPLEETAQQPPDTGSVPPKPVEPLEAEPPGEAAAVPGAEAAAPKPKTKGEVEAPLKEENKKIDQQMAEADVTDEQLARSNEPEFIGALKAKQEAKAHAETAPQEYRQFEQAELSQAEGEAAAAVQERTQAMHGERAAVFTQVSQRQGQTKSEDEQARAKVAADIQAIYDRTKTKVEAILSRLDEKVSTAFDAGAQAAKQAFEDYVDAKMEAFKERRYGGWFGWARWAKDKIAGMPSEVNAFYTEGRNLFLQKMDAVIDNVVAIIGSGLAEAKAEIAAGRQEIQKYVAGLPENLQKVGQQAAEGMESKFAGLEQSVDAKQDELIDTLANKYQEHLQAVDARIEEMKAANRGLVDKALDAVVGAIKVILKLKEMLTTVLAKVASVVGRIIRDPIGFLGNLISGIKQGFQNFVSKIATHLQTGLIGWLTGALGPMGIQIPDDIFSLPGIFSLVMQVLGISWEYVRGKAVKLLGEPVVKALETGFEVFKIFINEGPLGLWRFVQDQLSSLKEMVIEEIKSMVITEVIKAGVKWILSLLNPAGALIKAAMAIYDIVMFFVQRGSQIMELVNAVIDGIGAIAGGTVSGAAALIENALAKALPVVIGFLANLLGLGGLAKKVQGIIQKVRGQIDAAIDALIMKAKKFAARLFGRGGKKGAAPGEEETEQSVAVKQKVKAEIEKRTTAPFKSYEDLQAVVAQVEARYKPEGLKSLSIVPKQNAPGKFSIVAAASAGVAVDEAEVSAGPDEELQVTVGTEIELARDYWNVPGSRKQWFLGKVTQIDKEQKLVTITPEMGGGKLMSAFRYFKEGEGTRWRWPGEIHEKFKPKLVSVVEQGNERVITFEYEDDGLPMNFVCRQNLDDYLTRSVDAKNLRLKPVAGRGVTEAAATHVAHQGVQSAHLVADWFGGSGYKESLNLITTSAVFNRDRMGRVERAIAARFVARNAASFDLSIRVEWGELVLSAANAAAVQGIAAGVAARQEGEERAAVQRDVQEFVQEAREMKSVPQKRCLNVAYLATFYDQNGAVIDTLPENTGPDTWI